MSDNIIGKLELIKNNFECVINQLKSNQTLINTNILDLIDEINLLSVEI